MPAIDWPFTPHSLKWIGNILNMQIKLDTSK